MTPKAKALILMQKLIRLKNADNDGICGCVTCGKRDHWKSMQGGHFIAKGSSSYHALEEYNIWPQCPGCNGFGMRYGSAMIHYTNFMNDYYGRDFVEQMLLDKNKVKKRYKADYLELIEDCKRQIKENLQRIGE